MNGNFEQVMQEYINQRRVFSGDKNNLEASLENFWGSLKDRFRSYPYAERFLMEQKSVWHKSRVLSLNQMGVKRNSYDYATLFLELLMPCNNKHQALKEVLDKWYKQTSIILAGVQQIKIFEDEGVRKESYPMGVVSGNGQLLEFNLSLEKTREAYKIIPSDREFMTYYRRKAEAYWCLQAGLWPYTYKPVEISRNEKIIGSCCEVFYTGVSDFLLSMTKTLMNTESMIVHHGRNWLC